MISQVLVAMTWAAFLLGDVAGCRKGQDEDRAVTRAKEPSTSPADLARETGVTFPPSTRLIGFRRGAGIDDDLNFKVEIDAKGLAGALVIGRQPQPGGDGQRAAEVTVDVIEPSSQDRAPPTGCEFWLPSKSGPESCLT